MASQYGKSTANDKVHEILVFASGRREIACDSMLRIGSDNLNRSSVTCTRCLKRLAKLTARKVE